MKLKQGKITNDTCNNNKKEVFIKEASLVLDDSNNRWPQGEICRDIEVKNIKDYLDLSDVEEETIGLSHQEFIEIEDTLKALKTNNNEDYLSTFSGTPEKGKNDTTINNLKANSDSEENRSIDIPIIKLMKNEGGKKGKEKKQSNNEATNKKATNENSTSNSKTEKSSKNSKSESKSKNPTKESIKVLADISTYNQHLDKNIYDILFVEGDRFLREVCKLYQLESMPGSSDPRFIKILLNALNKTPFDINSFKYDLNKYLNFLKSNDSKKYENLVKSVLILDDKAFLKDGLDREYEEHKDKINKISKIITSSFDKKFDLNDDYRVNLDSNRITDDLVAIEQCLIKYKDSKNDAERIKEIQNTNVAIADINFEIKIKDKVKETDIVSRLISFPVYTGRDLGIYSDVSEDVKKFADESFIKSYGKLDESKEKLKKGGKISDEISKDILSILKNEQNKSENTIHSERALLAHFYYDIMISENSRLINELISQLKILKNEKGVEKMEIVQIWLDIFSTRDTCKNCVNILSSDHEDLVQRIIKGVQSKFPEVTTDAMKIYKDIVYHQPYNIEKIEGVVTSPLTTDIYHPKSWYDVNFLYRRYSKVEQKGKVDLKILDHDTRKDKIITLEKKKTKSKDKKEKEEDKEMPKPRNLKQNYISSQRTFFISENNVYSFMKSFNEIEEYFNDKERIFKDYVEILSKTNEYRHTKNETSIITSSITLINFKEKINKSKDEDIIKKKKEIIETVTNEIDNILIKKLAAFTINSKYHTDFLKKNITCNNYLTSNLQIEDINVVYKIFINSIHYRSNYKAAYNNFKEGLEIKRLAAERINKNNLDQRDIAAKVIQSRWKRKESNFEIKPKHKDIVHIIEKNEKYQRILKKFNQLMHPEMPVDITQYDENKLLAQKLIEAMKNMKEGNKMLFYNFDIVLVEDGKELDNPKENTIGISIHNNEIKINGTSIDGNWEILRFQAAIKKIFKNYKENPQLKFDIPFKKENINKELLDLEEERDRIVKLQQKMSNKWLEQNIMYIIKFMASIGNNCKIDENTCNTIASDSQSSDFKKKSYIPSDLVLLNPEKDGNCFYASILYDGTINVPAGTNEIIALRNDVADHINANPNTYFERIVLEAFSYDEQHHHLQRFFANPIALGGIIDHYRINGSIDGIGEYLKIAVLKTYTKNIKTNRVWAGNIEIEVIAKIKNTAISMHRATGEVTIVNPLNSSDNINLYYTGNHYMRVSSEQGSIFEQNRLFTNAKIILNELLSNDSSEEIINDKNTIERILKENNEITKETIDAFSSQDLKNIFLCEQNLRTDIRKEQIKELIDILANYIKEKLKQETANKVSDHN